MANPTFNTVLAVSLSCGRSIGQAIGYVMQKKGHNQVTALNQENYIKTVKSSDTDNTFSFEKKTIWTNSTWISGLLIYIIGSFFNIAALKFGAQSVIAPLSALTLVVNTILATKFLNEKFYYTDISGILLVILGSILAVIFGAKSVGDPTIFELQSNCIKSTFLIFFIIVTTIAIIDLIILKFYENKNWKNKQIKEITVAKKFMMMSYIGLASYFGSFNVLFLKTIGILIATFNINYFHDWLLYVVLIGFIAVNFGLEWHRQRALKFFGALFVVPIYQVLLIIGASITGIIFFDEFKSLKLYELILYIIAIIITLSGVWILAFMSKKSMNIDKNTSIEIIKNGIEMKNKNDNTIIKNDIQKQEDLNKKQKYENDSNSEEIP